jgi:beta-1,2-mannobiose phosphorylase / 1,2-beta-oligomannan phosphorylase
MFTVTRSEHNPILSPNEKHPWEAAAAFNGCPIIHNDKCYLVYRAMTEPQLLKEPHIRMSTIGRAISDDGTHYTDRAMLVQPDADFDRYGCEDPRVTKLGGSYYILYTALGGFPFSKENIRIAVAVSDDLNVIKEKHLVAPFNAKGMALFPQKINGKYAAVLTVNTDQPPSDICYAEFDRLEDLWSADYWKQWQENLDAHKIHIRRLPTDHLELGAVPVKTDQGWLLVYSHIQRYGHPDQVFGVEAILLDPNNPRTVIGRTKGPFMAPEAYYEHVGLVSNIVFPTGALIEKNEGGRDSLKVYYGAADTFCAMATIPLDNLLRSLTGVEEKKIVRFPGNPIITPRPGYFWEQGGTINPAAIELNGMIHILYRAVSDKNVSTIGYAMSHDGLSIDERLEKPIYFPRMPFEIKAGSDRDYGCEDPRVMKIGDRVYMTYTAYDGSTPRVAVSSISEGDFLARRWGQWSEPRIITPPGIADKDAAILPERFRNRYMIFHRVGESVCADFVSTLDFAEEVVDECIEIIDPRRGMWDGGKVGISAPPVKTDRGWLLLYHGVSWSTTYRVGAVLLDLNDPTVILARTAIPLFEPEEEYERKGLVPNVVFPCGLVVRGNTAYIYYGGGDSVIGVATVKMSVLLQMLEI